MSVLVRIRAAEKGRYKVDIKIIENALRDYKRKQSVVETTLARIETYQDAINNPSMHEGLFLGSSKEPGMPISDTYKGTSAVEYAILTKEEEIKLLQEWITDDKSRIYPYQIELEQINGALNALNKQQKFIIEYKYFEGMFWRELEKAFNDEFRGQNYITVEGIRKINKQVLELMSKILKPYYNRFKIKK